MTLTVGRYTPSAPCADPGIIELLRQLPVALLSDNLHRSIGSVGLRPFHRAAPMAGTAVTVRTRGGDNVAVLRAFDYCRPGDVLVVDAGGHEANAIAGGIMTFYMASIGMAGFVVDGAIRDAAELGQRSFPVYARSANHRGPYKDGPGEINVPVCIGGMVVNPGDIVVGDQDGLLAISPANAALVIEKAQAQQRKEEQTMQAIREGRWDRSFVEALEARLVN